MGMMHEHGKSGKQSDAMEEGMMKSMMAGTHHVMVVVSDEETKKEIENAEIEIRIIPSSMKKSFAVELMSMENHSCGGLLLEEKGDYVMIAQLKIGDKIHVADFHYAVE